MKRRTLLQDVVALLKSCTRSPELRQIHAHMIKAGADQVAFPVSKLLAAAVLVDFAYARSIFDGIHHPNLFNLNTMLRGHSVSRDPEISEAVSLFDSIRGRGFSPDQFSFISTLKTCARKQALHAGRRIHGAVVRSGFELYVDLRNTTITFYCACGVLNDAEELFEEFPQTRDAVSWNALMGGYLQIGRSAKVVELFGEMQREGFEVTPAAVVSVLSAVSGGSTEHCTGASLHGRCIKAGFCLNLNAASSIVTMYGKFQCVDSARRVFDGTARRDVVLWNCMVGVYAKCGLMEEPLSLLQQMKVEGVKANAATLAGLLSACASSGALITGQLIHRYAEEEMLELDSVLGTALIDMYSKCGLVEKAMEIFERMRIRDVKSWTAMITGFGVNGQATAALELFEEMEEKGGEVPNEVTFLSVLSACSHGGLVAAARECLVKMVRDYGYSPRIEHYGCVVDLLGRAGLLEEAYELTAASLPIQRDATAWRALLAACRVHGNVELGELARQALMALGDEHPTDSILLSNAYAVAGKCVGGVGIGDSLGGKMRKEAGYSSIETSG